MAFKKKFFWWSFSSYTTIGVWFSSHKQIDIRFVAIIDVFEFGLFRRKYFVSRDFWSSSYERWSETR